MRGQGSRFHIHGTRRIPDFFGPPEPLVTTVVSAELDGKVAVLVSTDNDFSIDVYPSDGAGGIASDDPCADGYSIEDVRQVVELLGKSPAYATDVAEVIRLMLTLDLPPRAGE